MGKNSKKDLRIFGIIFGIILLIVGIRLSFKFHSYGFSFVTVFGLLFILTGLLFPLSLRPVYAAWMKIAHLIGWVNTRVLLMCIFYVIISPIGLLMKIFGKDLLAKKIDKGKKSYWIKIEQKDVDLTQYGKQF